MAIGENAYHIFPRHYAELRSWRMRRDLAAIGTAHMPYKLRTIQDTIPLKRCSFAIVMAVVLPPENITNGASIYISFSMLRHSSYWMAADPFSSMVLPSISRIDGPISLPKD